MTTNPNLCDKKRLRSNFFRRRRFRRSSWSENLEKTEEEVTRKKMNKKNGPRGTKASPGRTDAKVQICIQTQTSCGMDTCLDDCVAAVTAAVAAYRRGKKRINSSHPFWGFSTWKVQSSCPDSISVAFAMYVVQQLLRPRYIFGAVGGRLHSHCLHGTLRPASCIRVVVQARNDLRPRVVLYHARVLVSRCTRQ